MIFINCFRLQCASEALRSDLYGWQRQKKTDLKLLLVEMAKKHIEFYEKSLASWEVVLPTQPSLKMVNDIAHLQISNHQSNNVTGQTISFASDANFSNDLKSDSSHISLN